MMQALAPATDAFRNPGSRNAPPWQAPSAEPPGSETEPASSTRAGSGYARSPRPSAWPRCTVYRWKKSDGQRGLSWDNRREETTRLDPEQVLRDLERRFARLVIQDAPSDKKDTAENRRYEQRLLTMIRVIMGYRKTARTPTSDLRVLEGFARFCAQNLAPEDLATVRRAVEMFVEHLRKENQ